MHSTQTTIPKFVSSQHMSSSPPTALPSVRSQSADEELFTAFFTHLFLRVAAADLQAPAIRALNAIYRYEIEKYCGLDPQLAGRILKEKTADANQLKSAFSHLVQKYITESHDPAELIVFIEQMIAGIESSPKKLPKVAAFLQNCNQFIDVLKKNRVDLLQRPFQTWLSDETIFEEHLKHLYSGQCPPAIPSILSLSSHIYQILNECTVHNPQFPALVLAKKTAKFSDLCHKLNLNCHECIAHKNTSDLIAYLQQLRQTIAQMKKNHQLSNEIAETRLTDLSIILQLIQLNRHDLLLRDSQSYFKKADTLSPIDHCNATATFAYLLTKQMLTMVNATQNDLLEAYDRSSKLSASQVPLETAKLITQSLDTAISQTLSGIGFLKPSEKCDILIIFGMLYDDLHRKMNIFCKSYESAINELGSNKYIQLTLGGHCCNEESIQNYIYQYRKDYLYLIARLQEQHQLTRNLCQELNSLSLLLKILPLYLQFGNLKQLRERLDEKPIYHRGKFQSILFDEIRKFSVDYKQDRGLLSQVLRFLQTNAAAAAWDQFFSNNLKSFDAISHNFEASLGSHLPYVERSTIALKFQSSPITRQKKASAKAFPYSDEPAEIDVSSKEAKPVKKKVETSSRSMQERLQSVKEQFTQSLTQLKTDCKGLETQKAIANANVHLSGVIGTLKRLMEHKDLPISRQQMLFLTLTLIRHGSLAVEQMLTALDRESNQIQSAEVLKEHLSHDLIEILFNCKFTNGALEPEYRGWIHEINFGEILERDLLECSMQGNFVEKLLAKVSNFVQGDAFTIQDIAFDLLTYAQKVNMLCIALQSAIQETKGSTNERHNVILEGLRQEFLQWHRLARRDLNQTLMTESDKQTIRPELTEIDNILRGLKARTNSVVVQNNVENIQGNLLLQLQEELDCHDKLQPFDAHLHISTILLLNQMIAEKYLYCLLDIRQIPYQRRQIDHNLAAMITLLGIDPNTDLFNDQERAFLTRSKAIRALTRYPALFDASYKERMPTSLVVIEQAVSNALEISRKEQFQTPYFLEDGFEIGDRNLREKIEQIKKVIETDLALLSSIMSKVEKAIQINRT